jgi:hypothetical protein
MDYPLASKMSQAFKSCLVAHWFNELLLSTPGQVPGYIQASSFCAATLDEGRGAFVATGENGGDTFHESHE